MNHGMTIWAKHTHINIWINLCRSCLADWLIVVYMNKSLAKFSVYFLEIEPAYHTNNTMDLYGFVSIKWVSLII